MSPETSKLGKVEIKDGVREVFYFAKKNGLQHYLVGAVCDGNSANQEATQWLLQNDYACEANPFCAQQIDYMVEGSSNIGRSVT